jgi:hypothetical protein
MGYFKTVTTYYHGAASAAAANGLTSTKRGRTRLWLVNGANGTRRLERMKGCGHSKNCTGTRAWLFGIAVALLLYFSGMEKATEFSDDLKQGYKPAHGIAALLGFTSE